MQYPERWNTSNKLIKHIQKKCFVSQTFTINFKNESGSFNVVEMWWCPILSKSIDRNVLIPVLNSFPHIVKLDVCVSHLKFGWIIFFFFFFFLLFFCRHQPRKEEIAYLMEYARNSMLVSSFIASNLNMSKIK